MKQKIRYFMILCLTVSLVFIQAVSAYACTIIPTSNYWYQLDFDVQNEALPADITVAALYPNEDGYVDYDGDGYRDHYRPTLGKLKFTNNSDNSVRLGSLSADAIEPNGTGLYDTTEDIEALKPNPQSPGGTESPPPPFLYEFAVIQDSQHFTVPIAVTYRLNPSYDEKFTIYAAPLSDYLIQTDIVVLGEVITVTEDSELFEYGNDRSYIYGYALVQIEEWLLGEGPEKIEIGRFSSSASCGIDISVGDRAYFLLKTPEDTNSIRYPLTSSFMGSKTVLTANNESAAAIETALEEQIAPTALPTTDEPVRSLFLPYISR